MIVQHLMCTLGYPWPGSLLETLPVGHPVFHGRNHSFRGGFESPKALVRKAILSTEKLGCFRLFHQIQGPSCPSHMITQIFIVITLVYEYAYVHACEGTQVYYVYHVMCM